MPILSAPGLELKAGSTNFHRGALLEEPSLKGRVFGWIEVEMTLMTVFLARS
jgi:hypothetical protein